MIALFSRDRSSAELAPDARPSRGRAASVRSVEARTTLLTALVAAGLGLLAPAGAAQALGAGPAGRHAALPGASAPAALVPATVAQQAYVKASNTDSLDLFGRSCALSGDTLVVGAPFERSSATGVNGDENDNGSFPSGAAYVYVRSGATWTQQAYLKASNLGGSFGHAVAISGDTIVVGAVEENSSATGVDGDGDDLDAPRSGAAYVFVRAGTQWTQQAYLKASNTDTRDRFGHAVAVSGDTIVVGAPSEDSPASGVNGGQGNAGDDRFDAGAAYVFERQGATWSQTAYLKASNTDEKDEFGISVGVSGDTVVVGAWQEDGASTGVNGDQGNEPVAGLNWNGGAAYVFVRDGASWSQQAYLKASNTDPWDFFGIVAISGDTIVVGAHGEDGVDPGIDGDQGNDPVLEYFSDSGAAYVFVRAGGAWSQQAYVKASNPDGVYWLHHFDPVPDRFGSSVALSGDLLVVGAPWEDSPASGVNGEQGNASPFFDYDAGAAYLFERAGRGWSQRAYLKSSATDGRDELGAVAVSGSTVAVGAPLEDSSAVGIDGDDQDDGARDSGAAYVFVVTPHEPPPLGGPNVRLVLPVPVPGGFVTVALP